jgi:hypothetical protein
MYWKGSDIDRYWVAQSTRRWCRTDVPLRHNEVVRFNRAVYDAAPKILLRQTADRPIAAIDSSGVWFGRSIIAILVDSQSGYSPLYLVALLNSKYIAYIYRQITGEHGRVFAQVKISKLQQLPVRTMDFVRGADRALHNQMVELVKEMLRLRHSRAAAALPHVQERIDRVDGAIDRLVYELYGATSAEIKFVESSFGRESRRARSSALAKARDETATLIPIPRAR